jgi:hypothetical protein
MHQAVRAYRGRGDTASPPVVASIAHRAFTLGAALVLLAACSSSGGRSATPPPTGARVPSPFEVGQQIGLGDARVDVASFRRDGQQLDVTVVVENVSSAATTIDAPLVFTIFYATQRHTLERSEPRSETIAPSTQATFALHFRVPSRYRYPLLWIEGGPFRPTTVVLRGTGG